MAPLRIAKPARRDIAHILLWSEDHFGTQAALRYEALLHAGITDVARSPHQVGTKERPEIGVGIRSWHLRLSRDRVALQPVGRPRHVVFYVVEDDCSVILRLLHDAMDASRHF